MKRRALALMVVLWLGVLLFVLGMALWQRQSQRYRSSNSTLESARAYELARAGLETARLRLDKDPSFPPRGLDQVQFSCSEAVYDVDNATPVGYYILEVDSRWMAAPYHRLMISSTGCWPDCEHPVARRKVRVQLDLNPGSSTYYRWVEWEE